MASGFVSFGLALLVTTQVSVRDLDDGGRADSADARPALQRRVEAQDGEPSIRRPRPDDSARRRRAVPRVAREERETIVVRLNHAPAIDTAETIRNWLESEENATGQVAANVIAVVITNDMIVTGSSKQLDSIRTVISELDRPAPQIRIKAMLVELKLNGAPEPSSARPSADLPNGSFSDILAELKKRGDLHVLARPVLLCADNQPAYLQLGSRVPRVTGATVMREGRRNHVTLENVGTILGITGRVTDDDSVTLEIDLERSHLGPDDEGTPVANLNDGSIIRTPHVKTLTLQTTVSLRDGQTVVLGGMVQQTEQQWGELLFLLQPEIIRQGGVQHVSEK